MALFPAGISCGLNEAKFKVGVKALERSRTQRGLLEYFRFLLPVRMKRPLWRLYAPPEARKTLQVNTEFARTARTARCAVSCCWTVCKAGTASTVGVSVGLNGISSRSAAIVSLITLVGKLLCALSTPGKHRVLVRRTRALNCSARTLNAERCLILFLRARQPLPLPVSGSTAIARPVEDLRCRICDSRLQTGRRRLRRSKVARLQRGWHTSRLAVTRRPFLYRVAKTLFPLM